MQFSVCASLSDLDHLRKTETEPKKVLMLDSEHKVRGREGGREEGREGGWVGGGEGGRVGGWEGVRVGGWKRRRGREGRKGSCGREGGRYMYID